MFFGRNTKPSWNKQALRVTANTQQNFIRFGVNWRTATRLSPQSPVRTSNFLTRNITQITFSNALIERCFLWMLGDWTEWTAVHDIPELVLNSRFLTDRCQLVRHLELSQTSPTLIQVKEPFPCFGYKVKPAREWRLLQSVSDRQSTRGQIKLVFAKRLRSSVSRNY